MEPARFTVRAADGTTLGMNCYGAESDGPVVLILHGIVSHMGWYRGLATGLAELGLPVYLTDRRGAGSSAGIRGHMRSWRVLVDDAVAIADELKRRHAKRPFHVVGMSLGSAISLATTLLVPGFCESLILFSPGLAATHRLPLRRRLELLHRSFVQPTKLYELPFTIEDLTDQASWRLALGQDRLRTQSLSAKFLVETFRMQRFIIKNMPAITVPLLCFLGERDAIVDNRMVMAALNRVRSPRLRIEIFEGASHILPATVPGSELRQRISSWLLDQAQPERERLVVKTACFTDLEGHCPPPVWLDGDLDASSLAPRE